MAKKSQKKEKTSAAPKTATPEEQKKFNDESILAEFRRHRGQLDLAYLRNQHIHFFTPCYGGMVTEGFFRSWQRLSMILTKYEIPFSLSTNANESLITRGRCHMVAYFMANEKATHMMFIDADITFDAVDILYMVQHNKEIITGAYPKKSLDWNSVQTAVDSGLKGSELEDTGAAYAVNYAYKTEEREDGTTKKTLDIRNGLVRVKDGATGFMLIQRSVIEKMIDAYPELWFKNDLGLQGELNKYTYLFFDCMHDPEDKRYLSEDYAFCRRWQHLGGEVWLDPLINLDHMGSYNFKGNTAKMFHRV